MRSFGRRRFGRRFRSFGRKRFARRLGAYEVLLEDAPSISSFGPNLGVGHAVTFPSGPNGAQSLRLDHATGQPPDEQGPGAAQQTIRVDQTGFTVAIPLWDNRLANKWQDDVSLASLRGWLRPKNVQLVGAAFGFNFPCKVRMAIIMQTVSEDMALQGTISSAQPQFIWTIASQRQRILWQRDWYMDANVSPGTDVEYPYWSIISTSGLGYMREPKLAVNGGGDHVRLKRCGRITRTRWPVLLVGIKGGFTTPDVDHGAELDTISSSAEMSIDFDGYLRAYVQR